MGRPLLTPCEDLSGFDAARRRDAPSHGRHDFVRRGGLAKQARNVQLEGSSPVTMITGMWRVAARAATSCCTT